MKEFSTWIKFTSIYIRCDYSADLTHLYLDKMDTILQTTVYFQIYFFEWKKHEFRLKFHWNAFKNHRISNMKSVISDV